VTDSNKELLTSPSDNNVDEYYLRVWEKQQEWTATRWSVTTFILGISFALFGLSLQGQSSSLAVTVQRIAGLLIYWFAYFIFLRYHDWSNFLREYLEELERTTSTRFKLQTRWKQNKQRGFRKWTSVRKLLIYFGFLYAIAVALLSLLGI
jgi:hypothetical protein